MNKPIWVPKNHTSGWRVHEKGKSDIVLISPLELAIERAREICARQEEEILKQGKTIIGCKNSYGRDPFPPRGL